MEKQYINNRDLKKICVIVDRPVGEQTGLAFVMHGLSGNKEQPHIETMAKAFTAHGCVTVRFDTRNTFGESEGLYEDATPTSYYADLEDVILWARTQSWFQGPFYLSGHSLGGLCTALYAERHPQDVKAIAPTATVISGAFGIASPKYQPLMSEWAKTGWRIEERKRKPGMYKKLKYAFIEDLMQYDLLIDVQQLTMPVLMIVGDEDASTPPDQQLVLFDALPGRKEFHLLEKTPHTFAGEEQLSKLYRIFDAWLDKIHLPISS